MSFSDFGMEKAAKRKLLDCKFSLPTSSLRQKYVKENAQKKFFSSRNHGERSLGKHTFKSLGSVVFNGLTKQIKKSYRFIILQLRSYYIKAV